jgi:methyl-accepting chemotaxis protein
MKTRFGIRMKMVVIFTTTIVVILAAVVVISTIINGNNAFTLARNNLKTVTEDVINSVNQVFEERVLEVQSIARTDFVVRFMETGKNREAVKSLLETQFGTYQQFENLFIADKRGKIIVDGTGGTAIGVDVTTYPFWELATKKLPYHIDDVVYRSPVTNRMVLVVATRIENSAGDFLGLVCQPMDWENFTTKHVDRVKIGNTGFVAIIDGAKNIIAHPDKKQLLTSSADLAFANGIFGVDEGFLEYVKDGAARFMHHEKMKIVDFTVITAINQDEYSSGVTNANLVVIVSSVFIGAVGLLIILLFSNAVAGGIKLIAEGGWRLAKGDFVLEGLDFRKIEKVNARRDEMGDIGKAVTELIEYLRQKAALAEQIAASNLNVEVHVSSEQDNLGKALKLMVASLNGLISQILAAAEQVSAGSNQVASSSQSLSQGASEQASSIEEITASITEINSQSKQNADHATEAYGLAAKSKDYAEKGNQRMADLIAAMNTINTSSEEIKKIVKTIDDIAFQINLLALNANVEAARAGKYGKGFAVVAEEVRSLAARSATSAKETNAMVEAAIKNIDTGNKLVEETAKQLADIVSGASKVVSLVEEISVASKEQSDGMQQINTGLLQIDQVTQSNTANAEECASAAEELSSQALQLKGVVSKFKLAESAAGKKDMTGDRWEDLRKQAGDDVIQNLLELLQAKNKAPAGGNGNGNGHGGTKPKEPVEAAVKQPAGKKALGPQDIIALDDDSFEHF